MTAVKEKKTEVLTVRITSTTKRTLAQAAERHEWTLSKMAEKILSTWAEQHADDGDIAANPETNQ